jgi:hydrogenase maturation protease
VTLLVAGIGNIFFGDDGFGPAVAQALMREPIEGIKIEDYGIRGMHLAFDLSAGYDRAFIIDAIPRGGEPGTLYVIEPDVAQSTQAPDAHRMDLENVFAFVRTMGGRPPPITLIGCEPGSAEETMELSPPVAAAITPAVELVRRLTAELLGRQGRQKGGPPVWTEV